MKPVLTFLATALCLSCFGAGELIPGFNFDGGRVPVALAATSDGGFVASFQGFVSKYDRNGRRDLSFQSALDTVSELPVGFIVPDGEGNFFVGPWAVYQNRRYSLAKISATGSLVTEFRPTEVTAVSSDEGDPDTIFCCCTDGAGGCFIGGMFRGLFGKPSSGIAHLDRTGAVTEWTRPTDRRVYDPMYLALINPTTLLVVTEYEAYFLSQNGDVMDLEVPAKGKWLRISGGAADPRFGVALSAAYMFSSTVGEQIYVWDYQGRLKRSFTQAVVFGATPQNLTWDEQGRLLSSNTIIGFTTAGPTDAGLRGVKRLLPNGQYDPEWLATLGFNLQTSRLVFLTSGNILVAGNYTQVMGIPATNLVKLTNGSGSEINRDQIAINVTSPASQTVDTNGSVTFTANVTGVTPLSFLWFKDGVALNGQPGFSGATSGTLQIASAQKSQAGNYLCAITTDRGTVTTSAGSLTLAPAALLANLSVRTTLTTGQKLIPGFVATGFKPILLRVAGPALTALNVGLSGMPDPQLQIYNGSSALVGQNDNWDNTLSSTFSQLGAFPFATNSKDSAALSHTLGIGSAFAFGFAGGAVLMELYDTQLSDFSNRLVNVSARNTVGTGDDAMIVGFVITGKGAKQLLIRGIGPKLASYGVSSVLADPYLQLYDKGGVLLGSNDNWDSSLAATFAQLGAFSLDTGSKDAAMLVSLPPGIYSVKLSGVNDGTGEALIEVYEVW